MDRKECEVLLPLLVALIIVLICIWAIGFFYRRDIFLTDNDHLRTMIEGEVVSVRAARRLLDKKDVPAHLVPFVTQYVTKKEDNIETITRLIGEKKEK